MKCKLRHYVEDDSDGDAGAANDARLEAELDVLWGEYKKRHTKKGDAKFTEPTKGRDKRTALGAGELGEEPEDAQDDAEGDEEEEEEEAEAAAGARGGKKKGGAGAGAGAEGASSNPLMVDLGGAAKAVKPSGDWFSNDLFNAPGLVVGSVSQKKAEAKAGQRSLTPGFRT